MLVFGTQPETLPVTVQRDASTGLPLLSEADSILQYLMAYLALPYSVAEHGCGKKASLILDRLIELKIPPYALWRGMILERDMSPQAMAETDARRRQHALIAENPLRVLADLDAPDVLRMLKETCPDVRIDGSEITVGPFTLHHEPKVQFVIARSHVYPIVWFWDAKAGRAVERVIDPTLMRDALFEVGHIRELLAAPEGLLFTAPMLGHFRLDTGRLTNRQRDAVNQLLPDGQVPDELPFEAHAALVRKLTGAAPKGMGDPDMWTYANNMWGGDSEYDAAQRRRTGRGDAYVPLFQRLLEARRAFRHDVHQIRAELGRITEEIAVGRSADADAQWSATRLEPLAEFAMNLVYFDALGRLADRIRQGGRVLDYLDDSATLQEIRGVGVRLRRRIDKLALASEDEGGEIDARALNPRFVRVTLETIRQMHEAGLCVCVDRVGNLHGLRLDAAGRQALQQGKLSPAALLQSAVVFGSHIDSVKDAGKFDGRLGVTAGIDMAHLLYDLERYHGVRVGDSSSPCLMVSAFIGEEMTFTGQGVSMPGSAAVAGRARVSDVHEMKNGNGERFGDQLVEMLRALCHEQRQGSISVVNRFANTDVKALLGACFDPTEFYTPHSYERHIEQAPVLDRTGLPMAFVGTIMGIHQEDFFFQGEAAEAAALEMNWRMRRLTDEEPFSDVRITVGILEPQGEMSIHETPAVAFRWTLDGEKNHAGATATGDRRDPGVAAARLAGAFRGWLDERPDLKQQGTRAVIGNLHVVPGTNRNVIPGQVSLTLALMGGQLGTLDIEDLEQTLRGYAIGTLAKSVAIGGEGMYLCRSEPISYATLGKRARLAIDLRAAQQKTIEDFRLRIDDILSELQRGYGVQLHSELQQSLKPFELPRTGQVLLMERSYGGSHNPNETELLVDITRGSVLQLAVAREVLAQGPLQPAFNLFEHVERCMPRAWLERLPRYTSGALHDTCNIAARAASLR